MWISFFMMRCILRLSMKKPPNILYETYRGKTLGRTLFNQKVAQNCSSLKGKVLDLAGGNKASYYRYLPDSDCGIVKTNRIGDDQIVDMNKPFPFQNNSFDAVLFFNAIYICENTQNTLKEILRVLKPGGKLYLAYPFLIGEIPEPHDYARFTKEGIERELKLAGFGTIDIQRIGDRASSAADLLRPFFLFNTIRVIVNYFAVFLDKIYKRGNPSPSSYFCVVEK